MEIYNVLLSTSGIQELKSSSTHKKGLYGNRKLNWFSPLVHQLSMEDLEQLVFFVSHPLSLFLVPS